VPVPFPPKKKKREVTGAGEKKKKKKKPKNFHSNVQKNVWDVCVGDPIIFTVTLEGNNSKAEGYGFDNQYI
jgi:hypothetical protein